MLRTVVNFSTGCYGNTAHRQESLPRASGSLAFSGVWKDEQLVKQEEVREGKSFPDRKGGLVKAELCSHRVWGGNKAIHCCGTKCKGKWTDRLERPDLRSQAEPHALWMAFPI